jgi:hypothetical protein
VAGNSHATSLTVQPIAGANRQSINACQRFWVDDGQSGNWGGTSIIGETD